MIPNKACMKDILNYVSENTKVEVDDMSYHNITISNLNLTMLLEQMSKNEKYTIEEIAYNFMQCYNNGLVDAKINYKDSKTIVSPTSDIIGVTLVGVNFMNQF